MTKKPGKSTTKTRKPRKSRHTVLADGPRPVDVHVGHRLRLRRMLLGISQEKPGEAVDLTFQQIQKYERGANRVGASRLFEFSRILDVPIEFFFDEMPKAEKVGKGENRNAGMSDTAQAEIKNNPMARRETLELARAYYKIPDEDVRKRLYELIRSIGGTGK